MEAGATLCWPEQAVTAERECVVIGGGLAGSMAALRLAQSGRSVLLLERERGAHGKVCGEFLSPEAVAYLRHAGLDPLALGAASIRKLRMLVGARCFDAELPFTALSLSRNVFDEALLARAEKAGAEVRRGIAVARLDGMATGWNAVCGDGECVTAGAVFLATGKHDLRGWARPAGAQNDLAGFKMHWRLPPAQAEALRGLMVLFLVTGGYGGVSLIEGDTANLCFVVRRSVLQRCGGGNGILSAILNQNRRLADLFSGARPLWERPLAIAPIPYGYIAGAAPSGLWQVGDQAAVIPSFTGDGMSIALHSGSLAAEMFVDGASSEMYRQALRRQLRSGMWLATAVSRAMVSGIGRAATPAALTVCPPLMRWIAEATRIPARVLPGAIPA